MDNMRYAAVALAVAACVLCTGCSKRVSSSADKTTFTFATWAAGQELQEFQQIIDGVNAAANGRYKVEVLSIPSDYYIKISTFIASKKTPDFFWLTQELVSKYAQLGAIANISAPFKASAVLNPAQYYEGVLASVKYNGAYYGLPWIANPLIVYYNKRLFDEAGVPYPYPLDDWRWSEFIDIASRLTVVKQDSLGNEYQQYGYIVDGWPNIETFIWAGGGDIIAEDGITVTLDSDAALNGLDILHDILSAGITPDYAKVSSLGANNVWFEKQRVAMFMGGIQDNFEVKNRNAPPDEQFDIGYAPMPVGLDGQSWSFDWTAATVLSAGMADNALAYEALETLTLAFFQWKIAPPLKDSLEQVIAIEPLKAPSLPTMEQVLQSARSANYVPEWNEINNLLWVKLYTGMLNDPQGFDYRHEAQTIAEQSRVFISKRK
jgi:multiple sugar transport system substrate-binding protein